MKTPLAVVCSVLALSAIAACSSDEGSSWASAPQDGGDAAGSAGAPSPSDASIEVQSEAQTEAAADVADTDDVAIETGPSPCPSGVTCVTTFPFGEDRDTSTEPAGKLDSYSCKATVDESGPEVVYRVAVPEAGFLSAAVEEASGVDVDVHILSAVDASACLDRGNYHARAHVDPGEYYVVIDTFVDNGDPQSGAFHVDIGFLPYSVGPCDMQVGEMPRVGDNGNHLAMPASGPVVMEAHLVTQEEPAPYPSSSTDELSAHYELSQERTGLVMHRTEVWAPLEGGSFYGCGIGSPDDFPVEHEGWYVNMYWTSSARPAKGTRMIMKDPNSQHAVVVAAGYETGPGDLSSIGGTGEETHFVLGTAHHSTLTLGIATDQALPFGPRLCQ